MAARAVFLSQICDFGPINFYIILSVSMVRERPYDFYARGGGGGRAAEGGGG